MELEKISKEFNNQIVRESQNKLSILFRGIKSYLIPKEKYLLKIKETRIQIFIFNERSFKKNCNSLVSFKKNINWKDEINFYRFGKILLCVDIFNYGIIYQYLYKSKLQDLNKFIVYIFI